MDFHSQSLISSILFGTIAIHVLNENCVDQDIIYLNM